MLELALESFADLLRLTYRTYVPGRGRPRPSARRLLVMSGFIPFIALVLVIHWLGFLLDALFVRGDRHIEIREPLFILGVPRSGTTHLHRLIARDPHLTTFSTWECLFAPSVSQRLFWLGLARLDARIGRPLGRLLDWVERRAFQGLESVHPMRLSDPEEDYFALVPALACFILILPFPQSERLWRMGAFDRDMPEAKRARIMAFYRRCLQKHLYVHGRDRRLLSKNAAFAPLASSLASQFPDARFIVCLREPETTLPSQLSSIDPGVAFFDVLSVVPDFHTRLTEQLGFYYENLDDALGNLPETRSAWVNMASLKADPAGCVSSLYAQLGLTLTPAFRGALEQSGAASRAYQSAHDYSPEQFGLTQADIQRELGPVFERLQSRSLE